MTTSERIKAVFDFKQPDRMPALEWGCWWHLTLQRWHQDGLDPKLKDLRWYGPGVELDAPEGEIGDSLGLDPFRIFWLSPEMPDCPQPEQDGMGVVHSEEDYLRIREWLFPEEPFGLDYLEALRRRRETGDMAVWMYMDGFFWRPRKLFGIEEHLFAFYDQPELMHRMNADLLAWYQRVLPRIFEYAVPDVLLVSEDLSYNHGPMLSQECFEEFIAPYYKPLTALLKSYGIHTLIDSDGDIMPIIPWLKAVGVEGLGPLERMAGVDVAELRRQHPDFLLLGGYDKMIMHEGEEAMRREFERLMPVIRQGGFIPTVDHQTPPDVSLEQYHLYRRLFQEYMSQL